MKFPKIIIPIFLCLTFSFCGEPKSNESSKKDDNIKNILEITDKEEFKRSLEGKSKEEVENILDTLESNNVKAPTDSVKDTNDKINITKQVLSQKKGKVQQSTPTNNVNNTINSN
ncbi:MAG: hypothetical protein GY830_00610 [Bacteroidetes bacterium]|nr:hypothetical protein [Bacteroidota bacterium]